MFVIVIREKSGGTGTSLLPSLKMVSPPWIGSIRRSRRRSRKERPCEGRPSAEFLGEPDEKSFRRADIAEPIRVFVPAHFAADELRAMLAEPGERIVDVVDSEHDAQVAETVHRGVPVIRD